MERFLLVVFLTLTFFHLSDTFILSLKKTNGSLDVEHLVGHMTLLEQMITGFQQTIKNQNVDITAMKTEIGYLKANQQVIPGHATDIATLKNEILNLKAGQQVISGHATDIATLKNEISNVKSNQQVVTGDHDDIITLKAEMVNMKAYQQGLDTRISDLQKQVQPGPISAEVTSLKNEVNAAKTEVTLVSNEMISLTSKFSNLTQDYKTLSSQMKNEVNVAKTKVTQVSNEVISLSSKFINLTQDYQTSSSQMKNEVKAMKTEVTLVSNEVISLTSKFNTLQQDYQTLSSQLMSEQNLTRTVHTVQNRLDGVLSRVHSADNDRSLLHDFVNRLNTTIAELNNNSTAVTTGLSAEIALLKTEVGFNIWLGSSNVNLQAGWITLKFQDIQYNKGDGYSTTTGVFTAPVSGTYLLWSQVYKRSGSHIDLYLQKGNSKIGGFYTATAGYLTGSIITTAAITAGEQVYVTVHGADIVNCCYFSRFGGSLLYRH